MRSVFIFCLAAGAPALRAQNSAATTQLDPVVVRGRDSDLVGVAGTASQGVVGAAELEARPFLRRGELLEVVPGVVITQHSGDGKANQYFLRGFNLDHGTDLSIAVDGLPVNMRSHAHGQGYADLNFLIPELVEQVDFNKGPFFADVGDFSAAGATQFRLFDTLPHDFATLTLGGHDFFRVAAGASQRQTDGALTGAAEFTHDDGPWALREDSNRLNGFFRAQWKTAAADYRLTAMAYGARWRSTDQIPRRAVESGALGRFGAVDPSDGGESARASVSFDGTWKGAAATTRVNVYALRYTLNLFSDFTYFLDDPVNGDQFNQRDGRWVAGGEATRTWSTRRSETTVGAQARGDFIGELGLFHTAQRVRLATIRDDAVDETSLGLFVKNATRWTEWLRTEAGLRGDGYLFRVDSDNARNSGTRRANIFSPKLGLALGPWAKTEFYANAGDGFHSNDARGTTIRVDPADGTTPAARVTPLVRSRGAELGVRTAAVNGLVSSVALWALDLDSELVFSGDAGDTEPTGRTRRYGIELANFWRVSPRLALDADVSFTHARYRDVVNGGTQIANSLATVVTAGAAYGAGEGWFGAARLRYFGPQPLVEDDSARAPASTTVNLRAGWRSKRWEFALDVLNALDRKNYDIAYAYVSRLRGEPAAGVDDMHFHPAEPRTLRVTIARRF
ncbi:MAG TPA: TonB-dependent receptor plug domain-containing protein [Opitutaceae bacterium]|nr:TonB-dependent receptor plug domain-containing protein [Opitutaceae bacterium]